MRAHTASLNTINFSSSHKNTINYQRVHSEPRVRYRSPLSVSHVRAAQDRRILSRRTPRSGLQRCRVAEVTDPLQEVCSTPQIEDVRHKGGLYTIQGSLETGLSRDAVLNVLTDYDGLARIYSSIENSQLILRGGQRTLYQTCRWEFLVFSGTFETRLTVDEGRESGSVIFNLVSSTFMRHFQGRWQVTELPNGACRVQHTLSIKPNLAPPEALASYTQKIFVRQVERLLEDLSMELCRLSQR